MSSNETLSTMTEDDVQKQIGCLDPVLAEKVISSMTPKEKAQAKTNAIKNIEAIKKKDPDFEFRQIARRAINEFSRLPGMKHLYKDERTALSKTDI